MLCCIRDTQEDPSFQEHPKTNKAMLMLSNTPRILAILFVLIFAAWSAPLPAEVLGRSGQGWLETIDGYPVVYVKGSHYEMGRQHGELLRFLCSAVA
jgi:hypothetical protein